MKPGVTNTKKYSDELGDFYLVKFVQTNQLLKKYYNQQFNGKFYPNIKGYNNEWATNCFIADKENENIFHNGPFPFNDSNYKFKCQKIYDIKEELIFL